jgi:hypothetical protein
MVDELRDHGPSHGAGTEHGDAQGRTAHRWGS